MEMREEQGLCTVFLLDTVTLKTSALQHSINDMAQFDDELEWNLLHTDSYFSMQFLFHS